VEAFPEGKTGFQVLRSDLDDVLIALVTAAGASVESDATVREVEVDGDAHRIEYTSGTSTAGDGVRVIRARWVLDCSGRSGVVARHYRRQQEGHATLALLGIWRRSGGWPVPDQTHTLVESFADGWAWSVPINDEVRYFTIMADPRVTEMERSKEVASIYRSEMTKPERMATLLDGARMEGRAWACSASMYSASRYAEGRMLLVGDAATFLDPVSSFGVKKALASAWRAAVVVHTALVNPEMESAAIGLHEGRERRVYASYSDQAAEVFRAAGQDHRHAFWELRGGVKESLDEFDEDGEPDIEQLRRDPAVLTAFDELRRRPSINLLAGSELQVVERPVITDNEVVLEERLATPDVPSGLRYLRGVDVHKVLQIAGDHSQVPDLFEAYCRLDNPVILPDFMGALSVLLARGILVNRTDRD
jgi:flavin-dependent dehydrogenase